jgi:hypothetical protein
LSLPQSLARELAECDAKARVGLATIRDQVSLNGLQVYQRDTPAKIAPDAASLEHDVD